MMLRIFICMFVMLFQLLAMMFSFGAIPEHNRIMFMVPEVISLIFIVLFAINWIFPEENVYSDRWKALINSKRIRYLGSAKLGEALGSLICVEFHADGDETPEETYRSKKSLTLYADTLIKRGG